MMSPLANFSDVAGLDVPVGRLFANSAQVNTACTRTSVVTVVESYSEAGEIQYVFALKGFLIYCETT